MTRRRDTVQIPVPPADGEVDPCRPLWSRSRRKGELLRIRVEMHHDEGQVAFQAYYLLSLLPPERAADVLMHALELPGVDEYIRGRLASEPIGKVTP